MTATARGAMSGALRLSERLFVLLLAVGMIALAGCGSTKVYTTDKTIVYKDSIYNMSGVQRVGSRVDGTTADGTTVNLGVLGKKDVEAQLKANSGMVVTTVVLMDDKEMVYERKQVKKYSDYNKMKNRLDGAMKDITRFMADGKKTQLKL